MAKGLIFSGTEHANPFYGKFFPDIYIYKSYNSDLVGAVIEKQSKRTKIHNMQTDGAPGTPETMMLMLMDDCLSDQKHWISDPNLADIFFNGRHYHIGFFLTTQYPMSVPSKFRNNSDYTFIYSDKDVKNRMRIHENYCGMIPREDFKILMDQVCTDFRCLVIDNRKKDHADWREVVKWYKAEDHGQFRFGSKSFWNYAEAYQKGDSDDDKDAQDISYIEKVAARYGKPRSTIKVNILD